MEEAHEIQKRCGAQNALMSKVSINFCLFVYVHLKYHVLESFKILF